MKIVHLCLGNFFIDNYSYQENMLSKYHVLMGHDVTVIASTFTFDENGKGASHHGYSEYDNNDGCHVVRLPYKKPERYNKLFRHFQRFEEILVRENPDVIFSHNVSFGDTAIVARYLKSHPSVKLFADNHADYVNSAHNILSKHILHPVIWRYYAHIMSPYMTKCFGVTPMRCRFIEQMYHINSDIVEFLPLGVDDESIPRNRDEVRQQIRRELGVGNAEKMIFTGGKIDRLKNTHVLVAALKRLEKSDYHLVICGVITPEIEWLKNELFDLPNVHYLGWCDAKRVMDCMVASDMACFPGTHSTLWEQSVGVGLPLVCKRWAEMEHVNVNGNCLLIDGQDELELANSVVEVLENLSKYGQRSKNAASSFKYSEIAKKAIGIA